MSWPDFVCGVAFGVWIVPVLKGLSDFLWREHK